MRKFAAKTEELRKLTQVGFRYFYRTEIRAKKKVLSSGNQKKKKKGGLFWAFCNRKRF